MTTLIDAPAPYAVAPTPAARITTMREGFDALIARVGELQDRLYAAEHPAPACDQERAVVKLLTRLGRLVDQADAESVRGDHATAWLTLGAVIATVQGELPVQLRALAAALPDPHAAEVVRGWAADLEALAESEA